MGIFVHVNVTYMKLIPWIDSRLYPFQSKFITLNTGNMHSVDEGDGDVLLFVHGTPTWSFLYREFISALSLHYRCIAIDHIGFGLSSKTDGSVATPVWHASNLTEFIKKLNLDQFTIIVHDFGGPIGLSSALSNSDKIKSVILFNTWLWSLKENERIKKADKILHSYIGKLLYIDLNFSLRTLLKRGFHDKKNLNKAIHNHYNAPFANRKDRAYLLKLAKELSRSSEWYEAQWDKLSILSKKPWLVLWGIKDPFFGVDYLDRWTNQITNVTVRKFDCGHFVQEEKTKEAIDSIRCFLE